METVDAKQLDYEIKQTNDEINFLHERILQLKNELRRNKQLLENLEYQKKSIELYNKK